MLAGLTTHTPLDGATWSEPLVPAGQPIPENDNDERRRRRFAVLRGDADRSGRGPGFDDRDVRGSARVALVNERYAERIFPNQNPIGQRLRAL